MASPAWIPAAMEPNSRRASAGFTSHDPQGPDHGDAALPGERERSRHAVARGAGDRERGEALPALAEPGGVGAGGGEDREGDGPRPAGGRRGGGWPSTSTRAAAAMSRAFFPIHARLITPGLPGGPIVSKMTRSTLRSSCSLRI